MAHHIVISNEDYIKLDHEGANKIQWEDRGNAMPELPHGVADSIHYVIWDDLPGQNEVQKCDANHDMTGNFDLNSVNDIVHGSVTVQDLLDWGELRRGQIAQAKTDYGTAGGGEPGTASEGKTWIDYDPNYS